MPDLQLQNLKELRCKAPDCGKLLLEQQEIVGTIRIKCRCGTMNTFTFERKVEPIPYQERLGMVKKRKA